MCEWEVATDDSPTGVAGVVGIGVFGFPWEMGLAAGAGVKGVCCA